jgi:hypothetical protein
MLNSSCGVLSCNNGQLSVAGNVVGVCKDSPLSITASVIGILTFATTVILATANTLVLAGTFTRDVESAQWEMRELAEKCQRNYGQMEALGPLLSGSSANSRYDHLNILLKEREKTLEEAQRVLQSVEGGFTKRKRFRFQGQTKWVIAKKHEAQKLLGEMTAQESAMTLALLPLLLR